MSLRFSPTLSCDDESKTKAVLDDSSSGCRSPLQARSDMDDQIRYLQSLPSVRERCSEVFALAEADKLDYWSLNPSKESEIVNYCSSLIVRDFGSSSSSIPPHGRWRHFLPNNTDRLTPLIESWSSLPPLEVARRLVDLFVVSVLMDAGAGDVWSYHEESTGQKIGRSEGLAVGTLWAFKNGLFSSDPSQKERVDAEALERLTPAHIADAMQSRPGNEMAGLEGRAQVLQKLGGVLSRGSGKGGFFPPDSSACPPRPGNMIDYLLSHSEATPLPRPVMKGEIILPLSALWEVVVSDKGLAGVWPTVGRCKVGGKVIGDVWECEALKRSRGSDDGYVTFHKLSQWLTYSLIEVLEKMLGWHFEGKDAMTGLPEYRNGGLLIDFHYVVPKPEAFTASLSLPAASTFSLSSLPPLPASHPAMIEWRAITVITLDRLRSGINARLGLSASEALSLPQVLEAATWKGGREIAKKLRPKTGGPPVNVLSDGTVF